MTREQEEKVCEIVRGWAGTRRTAAEIAEDVGADDPILPYVIAEARRCGLLHDPELGT